MRGSINFIVMGCVKIKVLIVEDEKRLAEALVHIFNENNYHTDIVYDGKSGYDYASLGRYDVIVLDIMLPQMNGLEVVQRLRREGNEVPIILLTALGTVPDKVKGLNSGADDYLTKPFSPDELLARVNALTRRHGSVVLDELKYRDIRLELNSAELCCKNENVKLSYKEFEIMKIFLSYPEAMVTKERLIEEVWGVDSDAVDNNVEAYISFLRKKLRFLGSELTIRNYQKIGYKLEVLQC